MIKQMLRNWLGVKNVEPNDLGAVLNELSQINYAIKLSSTDRENTLREILDLQQKFDCLAEALGVVIVVDSTTAPLRASILSTKKDGLLGDAQAYINAVTVADKLVGLQYRALEEQARLLSDLQRPSRKR